MKTIITALALCLSLSSFSQRDCNTPRFKAAFIGGLGIEKSIVTQNINIGIWGNPIGGFIGVANGVIKVQDNNKDFHYENKAYLTATITGRVLIKGKYLVSPFASIGTSNYSEYGIRTCYLVNPDMMLGVKVSNNSFGLTIIGLF